MANALKKVGKFAEDSWRKLPWWVRGLLSARRWYLGIKGLPALGAAVLSLAWGGAVVGFFGSLPAITQIMWASAGVLAALGTAGHVGGAIRARGGNVRLMSDLQFLRHARSLSKEASSYIIRRKEPSGGWSSNPEIQNLIDSQHDVEKREEMSEYFNDCHPRVMVMLKEAVRRGVISEDDIERGMMTGDLDAVTKFLAHLVMKLQLRANHAGL